MLTFLRKRRELIEKSYTVILLLMNVLSLIFGMVYLSMKGNNLFWNGYGFLLMLSLFGNIGLAAAEKIKKGLSNLYLLLSAVFMLAVLLINTVVSCTPTNKQSQSTISAVLLFSLFVLGGAIAAEKLQYIVNRQKSTQNMDNSSENNTQRMEKAVKPIINIGSIIRIIIIILLSAVLYFGLFLAINLLRVHKNGLLEVFIAEYALFFAIIFLSVGVLIRRLLNRKKYFLYHGIVLATTIFIVTVCLLPFLSIPSLLKNAEDNYTKAFNNIGEVKLDYSKELFRQQRFSLPEYFFGTPSREYQVKENVLFYQGTEGVDKGIKLYFDVYTPTTDGSKLPGGNSVLIRIHGGGWTTGDKGEYNFAQMNKYFASQGYIVFDIQYGLSNVLSWLNFTPVQEARMGDFSIDDMVRHIGLFTNYLVDHQSEYPANLKSVFISGGSAGGQLTLASGLAYVNKGYSDFLNPQITIKGVIPFYPANGLSTVFGIEGRQELVDPIALVDEKSPPCLIYQGSHDGLVDPAIAYRFRDAYLEKGNEKCAVITMPFGGHASDLYFSGYYNQVFLYYMERFLYQYK